MAFTVEDGSIVADANAYVTVAFWRAYFVDRGVTAAGVDSGAYGDALVQAAIIKATDYVDKRFSLKFKGEQVQSEQSLQWPRVNVYNSSDFLISASAIPKALKYAICEYAEIARKLIDLLPLPPPPFPVLDPTTGETTSYGQGQLTMNRDKVGPLESEQRYADLSKALTSTRGAGAQSSMVSSIYLPEYPVADEWLKELCVTSGSICLERA